MKNILVLFAAIAAFSAFGEDSRRIAFQTALPAATAPKIDGVLDDACWQSADWNDRYYEYVKADPKRTSPGTKNAIVWDANGLYIAISNPEKNISKLRRNVTRNHHGVTWCDDCAEIYFDPDAKGIGYYKFVVNSRGCFDDEWQMDRANHFSGWNSEAARAAAVVDEKNCVWTLELYVPWSDLGRSSAPKPGDLMMFNHNRFRYAQSGWGDFCSSAPEADYRRPENFGYVLFSDSGLPQFEDIANRIAQRLKLAWHIEIGKDLAYNDESGLHLTTAADFAEKTKAAADRLARCAALVPGILTNDCLEVCEIPRRKELEKPSEYDGHNGYYLRNLQRNYETPHLDWGRDLADSPKVMFGVSYYGARMRHVAEMLERVDLKGDVFTTFWGSTLGGHGPYDDPVSGGTPNEAEARFGNLLNGKPDLVSFWNIHFDKLRGDFRYEIFRRMKDEGMGLLLIDAAMPSAFTRLPRDKAAEEKVTALAPYAANKVRVHPFGKGRIVRLERIPDRKWDLEWRADFECRCAFMARLYLAAAGRLPGCIEPVTTNGAVVVKTTLPEGASVEWRMRNSRNEIVRSGERPAQSAMAFLTDGLPAGAYTLDLIARSARPWWGLGLAGRKTLEFGYVPFTCASPVGLFEIKAPHAVDEAGPFEAEVAWTVPVREAGTLELALRDLPGRRLRVLETKAVRKGCANLKHKFAKYPMPGQAGYLEATLRDKGGRELARAWRIVYFPNWDFEDYPQINWQDLNVDGLVDVCAPRMVDEWGWNCNLCENGPYSALFGSRGQPVIALLRMGAWDSSGAVRGTLSGSLFNWNGKRMGEAQKEVQHDENPFRPEVQAIIDRECKAWVEQSRAYGHLCYNLGDECGFSTSAGYGKSDEKLFPQFLERKYGTIANYNAIRGTNYTSFAEVPHKKLREARDVDDTQSWFDQIQYAEAIYAKAMQIHRDAIVRYEPKARVGAEGSSPGDLELTVKGLKYWGPYKSRVQNELLREISAPDVLRGVWWGGYVNEPRDGLIRLQWEFMLTGGSNCNLWYTAEVGSTMGITNGAFEIAPYFEKELPHLNNLRWGAGHQLALTPLHRQGLALWYSHESNRAAEIDERCAHPGETQNAFLEFCYRHGLGVELITKNRLEALKRQKLVIVAGGHALTDAEIDALKAFKANGGTVVFDVRPCTFTSWMTRRKPDDNPLAGVGETLGESLAVTKQKLKDTVAFDARLLKILATRDITPELVLTGAEKAPRTIMRLRDGDGFTLAGILFPVEADGGSFTLSFADGKPRHVYKVDGGYLGCISEIKLDPSDYPWYQFSFFDSVQEPPKANFTRQGQRVTLTPAGLHKNGIYRIEMTGPRSHKAVWCIKDGQRPWTYDFALDDPKGEYVFKLTDLATGLSGQMSLNF